MEIILHNISKKYPGKELFKNFNFIIPESSIVTIIGKNASGKSTLLKIIVGIVKQDEGEVLYKINEMFLTYETVKKDFGFGGNNEFLIETLSGYDYLRFIGKIYKIPKKEFENRLNYLMDFFNINNEIFSYKISTYSSGYKRMTELFSVFIHNPGIIILDEPFKSLDNVFNEKLNDYLISQKEKGKTMIIATHNNGFVNSYSDISLKL